MRLRHYPAVRALWEASPGVGLSEADSRANIAAYLKRNPRMSFVARVGGQIIGAVLCGHDGRRGYLHHLAVASRYRRRGVGGRLVAACLAELAKAGIQKCNIFIYAHNDQGEAFWKHNGWAKREDLRLMQKPIQLARKKLRQKH
jgi:ribosomal protein S18 acetylase RimI-like enzyme